jgi:hypothetical protein
MEDFVIEIWKGLFPKFRLGEFLQFPTQGSAMEIPQSHFDESASQSCARQGILDQAPPQTA